MKKKGFLDELRLALSGEVPQREINKQIDYYDNYIKQESINKNEDIVIEELGSSLLIAKTIIDGYERTYGSPNDRSAKGGFGEQTDPNIGTSSNDNSKGFNNKNSRKSIHYIPWQLKLLLLIIMLIILIPIIIFASILIKIIIRLLPIILIIIVVSFLINLFKRQ